jgi:prepilin-type N-terminal cleavage/methylation domain-containing protein/prepilin-type processing-associated H-X9-DG protein
MWIRGRNRCLSYEGFTLLELLVVIGLLALLASLMLPALARTRQAGHGAICVNNLRQWGLATCLYILDHDDLLPPDGTPNPGNASPAAGWYIQLPIQLGIPPYHSMPWRTNAQARPGYTIWLCPANRRRSNGRNLFHYCLNGHVDGTGDNDQPCRFSALRSPANLVWLFDSKNLPAVGYWGYVHTNLHRGGAQLLFLDGHARRFSKPEYWDAETDRARTDNPEIRWVP